MLNIVIPMAGAGSRFANEGYTDPKPLILIHGVPMIKVVIENVRPSIPHRFIFICQKKHVNLYGLSEKFQAWAKNSLVIELDELTQGAACTVLKAHSYIDNKNPLMIVNSDQYIDLNIDEYLKKISDQNLDGLIMTMKANDPKWSFIEINSNHLVSNVVEKKVVSDEATVGIYNFKQGKDFIFGAKDMILKNIKFNNEFFVAPVFNMLIKKDKKIGFFNIGEERRGMFGLGTPADLQYFIKHQISQKVNNL
jgi:dTDP-glucose pyrophosphorylase